MNNRKILKVKLTNEGKVDTTYKEFYVNDGGENKEKERNEKGDEIAHDDLVNLFDALRIHMAATCEQDDFTAMEEDPERLGKFRVTQISIAGEDEHEGVVITGQRTLSGNKVLNLNSPFTKFDPQHSDYGFAGSLRDKIDELLMEADQYINGKHAPSNQLNLFDAPQDGAEAPKKRGRKKKSSVLTDGLDEEEPVAEED